ncbi:MAG: PAS domain S-box protein [Chthoniobacteraceae bacterium]
MNAKKARPSPINALRKRAEERLQNVESKEQETLSPAQARHVLHDLHVHQIELEMQNEELRRAQTELEASRERYFDLYDMAPVGYFTLSEKGMIQEANLTAAKLLGVERGALVKQPLTRFILCEDQDIYYKHHRQLVETRLPQVCELRLTQIEGAPFWANVETIATTGREGAPAYRMVISDITKRKRAEEALDIAREGLERSVRERTGELQIANIALGESEGRFRQMAENVREVFWLADAERTYAYYTSPAYEEIWGRPREELARNPCAWMDAVHPEDRELANETFRLIGESGVPGSCEYRIIQPDGSVRWILDQGSPVRDDTGRVYRMAGVARDITERKKTEAALIRLQEELLKISEREKQLIAQELHDGLCQHLSGTAMMGSLLYRRLSEEGSPEAGNAKQIGDLLKIGVDEARNLAHGLHPVRAGSDGLEEALMQYAKTATNLFHIQCTFRYDKSVSVESQDVATHLFRITQEAVNNAMKHGQASRVFITLKNSGQGLILAIRDNGVGIPEDRPLSTGMGIQIMHHRAAAIDAEITIRRAGKRGTVVTCKLPAR